MLLKREIDNVASMKLKTYQIIDAEKIQGEGFIQIGMSKWTCEMLIRTSIGNNIL